MNRRTRAREVALQLLYQLEFNPALPRPSLEKFVRDRLRDKSAEPFCFSLYDGYIANKPAIDGKITLAAQNWRLARMAVVDRNVLRLGAVELLYTPDTPVNVVINEAVELARRYGSADSPAFINGVLDRLHRNR